jgi:hypothetical protein
MPDQPTSLAGAMAAIGQSAERMAHSLGAPSATPPRVGPLARAKLTEPVLFYVYGAAVLWILASAVAAAITGAWLCFGTAAVGVLFTATAGGWSARASTFSPREMVQTLRRAGGSW